MRARLPVANKSDFNGLVTQGYYAQALAQLNSIDPRTETYKNYLSSFQQSAPRSIGADSEKLKQDDYFALIEFDLIDAAFNNQPDLLIAMIAREDIPFENIICGYKNNFDNGILLVVACLGHAEILAPLLTYCSGFLDKNPQLIKNEISNLNIYHLSAMHGTIGILEQLIQFNISLGCFTQKSAWGKQTVLDCAIKNRHPKWVAMLKQLAPEQYKEALASSGEATKAACSQASSGGDTKAACSQASSGGDTKAAGSEASSGGDTKTACSEASSAEDTKTAGSQASSGGDTKTACSQASSAEDTKAACFDSDSIESRFIRQAHQFFISQLLACKPEFYGKSAALCMAEYFCGGTLPSDTILQPLSEDNRNVDICYSAVESYLKELTLLGEEKKTLQRCIYQHCFFTTDLGRKVMEEFIDSSAQKINDLLSSATAATLIFFGSGWLAREYELLCKLDCQLEVLNIICVDSNYAKVVSGNDPKVCFLSSVFATISRDFIEKVNQLEHVSAQFNIQFIHQLSLESASFDGIPTILIALDFDIRADNPVFNSSIVSTFIALLTQLNAQDQPQPLHSHLLLQLLKRERNFVYSEDQEDPLLPVEIRRFQEPLPNTDTIGTLFSSHLLSSGEAAAKNIVCITPST